MTCHRCQRKIGRTEPRLVIRGLWTCADCAYGLDQSGTSTAPLNGAPPDEQLTLDALPRPLARNSDPVTSHAAAALAEPRAGTNRALALRVLREHPDGLTDYELAALTGLQQNSIGKRRTELRDAGFVRATGRQRRAPSGAWAMVWEAVS